MHARNNIACLGFREELCRASLIYKRMQIFKHRPFPKFNILFLVGNHDLFKARTPSQPPPKPPPSSPAAIA